jgi:hypothetical protein
MENVAYITRMYSHLAEVATRYSYVFTRPRCAVMTHRMTDTQPVPHDRDCPQGNLILRGRIQGSHHPAGGYLPSYLFIDVSLQKSKLHKVNA